MGQGAKILSQFLSFRVSPASGKCQDGKKRLREPQSRSAGAQGSVAARCAARRTRGGGGLSRPAGPLLRLLFSHQTCSHLPWYQHVLAKPKLAFVAADDALRCWDGRAPGCPCSGMAVLQDTRALGCPCSGMAMLRDAHTPGCPCSGMPVLWHAHTLGCPCSGSQPTTGRRPRALPRAFTQRGPTRAPEPPQPTQQPRPAGKDPRLKPP